MKKLILLMLFFLVFCPIVLADDDVNPCAGSGVQTTEDLDVTDSDDDDYGYDTESAPRQNDSYNDYDDYNDVYGDAGNYGYDGSDGSSKSD